MTTMKKESIAALSALAALSLGLVAAGCGSDTTAANAGAAGTVNDRQAAGGSPGPAPCGTEGIEKEANGGVGFAYISCIDQPVTVWAASVDPFDWTTGGRPDEINGDNRRGPGTRIDPSTFLLAEVQCNSLGPSSWGWRIGVTLADGSKGSARAQLSDCRNLAGMWQPHFNTANGPTSVVITTDTGKRVKLVTKGRREVPGLRNPDRFYFFPIFIRSVLLR